MHLPKPEVDDPVTGAASHPFFLIGCVRSGTTMLRNILRLHPNLACPEETHFLRWGDPLGTDSCHRSLTTNPVLRRHREIDNITEAEFKTLFQASLSKADLYERYMRLFIERNKPGAKRWFDKTPQNVYGSFLIAAQMPHAKFVHIVRNPLNVAASLKLGHVVKVPNIVGAANYWNEAIQIVRGFKRAYPARVYELRYEDVMIRPQEELAKLLNFLHEPFDPATFSSYHIKESDHRETDVLDAAAEAHIRQWCQWGMKRYRYL
jgi:hypothetical protein